MLPQYNNKHNKVLLCLTDVPLCIYKHVKHFGMANIKLEIYTKISKHVKRRQKREYKINLLNQTKKSGNFLFSLRFRFHNFYCTFSCCLSSRESDHWCFIQIQLAGLDQPVEPVEQMFPHLYILGQKFAVLFGILCSEQSPEMSDLGTSRVAWTSSRQSIVKFCLICPYIRI